MKNLSDYRSETGRTFKDIADEVGISRSYLSEVASGKKLTTPDIALRIVAATGGAVDIASILAPCCPRCGQKTTAAREFL